MISMIHYQLAKTSTDRRAYARRALSNRLYLINGVFEQCYDKLIRLPDFGPEICLAIKDDRDVGTALVFRQGVKIEQSYDWFRFENDCIALYVDPAYRRQGIGTGLVNVFGNPNRMFAFLGEDQSDQFWQHLGVKDAHQQQGYKSRW